jgi:hypothetical protein
VERGEGVGDDGEVEAPHVQATHSHECPPATGNHIAAAFDIATMVDASDG